MKKIFVLLCFQNFLIEQCLGENVTLIRFHIATSTFSGCGGDLTATTKTYSVGLIQLSKQVCIDEEERQSQTNSTSTSGGEEDGSAKEADSEEEKKPSETTMGATVHT